MTASATERVHQTTAYKSTGVIGLEVKSADDVDTDHTLLGGTGRQVAQVTSWHWFIGVRRQRVDSESTLKHREREQVTVTVHSNIIQGVLFLISKR